MMPQAVRVMGFDAPEDARLFREAEVRGLRSNGLDRRGSGLWFGLAACACAALALIVGLWS
jgi:hypothetical protein